MIATVFRLYVERIDPGRNMARFYALSIEPSLFGGVVLCRRWGRIGTYGREHIVAMASEREALQQFLALLSAKRRRGYRPPVTRARSG